jgi:hypothetical protein
MKFAVTTALALTVLAGPVLAQRPAVPAMPAVPVLPTMPTGAPDVAAYMAQSQQMLAAMEKAQASAIRPGDERLGCAALEKEFTAVVKDPALTSYLTAAGAAAQRDMATMQTAQGKLAAQTAAAAAAAMTPQAQAAQAAMAQRMQTFTAQSQQWTAFLPKIMRAAHVLSLAAEKSCTWFNGAEFALPWMAIPGVGAPGLGGSVGR